jgi:hypothetical protein
LEQLLALLIEFRWIEKLVLSGGGECAAAEVLDFPFAEESEGNFSFEGISDSIFLGHFELSVSVIMEFS